MWRCLRPDRKRLAPTPREADRVRSSGTILDQAWPASERRRASRRHISAISYGQEGMLPQRFSPSPAWMDGECKIIDRFLERRDPGLHRSSYWRGLLSPWPRAALPMPSTSMQSLAARSLRRHLTAFLHRRRMTRLSRSDPRSLASRHGTGVAPTSNEPVRANLCWMTGFRQHRQSSPWEQRYA